MHSGHRVVGRAFVTYTETKRTSKHPELFGKGALEGVAASESELSRKRSEPHSPLTLGITGETVAAVLLGAFTIHGLHPVHFSYSNMAP